MNCYYHKYLHVNKNSDANICIFADDNISPSRMLGISGIKLAWSLQKNLLEDFFKYKKESQPTKLGSDLDIASKKRRGKHERIRSLSRKGDSLIRPLAPPLEYGGKKAAQRKTDISDSKQKIIIKTKSGDVPLEVDTNVGVEFSVPGSPNWDEFHDVILVALAAGWVTEDFGFIQDSLWKNDTTKTVHVTLDASDSMFSAMKRAYINRDLKKTETDSILRYGAVINDNSARNDQNVVFDIIQNRVLPAIYKHPDNRLIVVQ